MIDWKNIAHDLTDHIADLQAKLAAAEDRVARLEDVIGKIDLAAEVGLCVFDKAAIRSYHERIRAHAESVGIQGDVTPFVERPE